MGSPGVRGSYPGRGSIGGGYRYGYGPAYGGPRGPIIRGPYFRGPLPRGAIRGGFWGGVVVGGIFSPFWWPFYAVPVPIDYYAPYGYPSDYEPPYVVVVPQAEPNQPPPPPPPVDQQAPADEQVAPDQQSSSLPPKCYGPQVDKTGNMLRDQEGNMIPDFTKPVTCPPLQ